MHPLLAFTHENLERTIEAVRLLVECESPSGDMAALARTREIIADSASEFADVRKLRDGHLWCEFHLPGADKDGQILVLGHFDTVWPMGTLAAMPFRRADGRLWGPGVLDMKAAIAFLVTAVRGLRELDLAVRRRVVLLLTTDEETGSQTSRALIEDEARRSMAALVLEPGTGLTGKLKTARKGVGVYELHVKGVAAHAGVDPGAGASAVLEICRQIDRIVDFARPERGLTVNPGVIRGGTRSNVIAAEAQAEIDLRVLRMRDAAAFEKKLKTLKPFDKRCTIEVAGGVDRPPMERSRDIVSLFRLAQRVARDLDLEELEESLTGGGSDGNLTAAAGTPTLDGLGAVGEGAHAPHESILEDCIAGRTALLAGLIHAL
jgi:glutamate carboxypeptidase